VHSGTWRNCSVDDSGVEGYRIAGLADLKIDDVHQTL